MPTDPGRGEATQELRFTHEDVERFAAVSGDRNPLHLDPTFARRTPFGECIVQGALVAFGMLGGLPRDELERVRALRAWFSGPVIPGACYRLSIAPARAAEGAWEMRLTGRGKPLARLVTGPTPERIAPRLEHRPLATRSPTARTVPMRITAAEPAPSDLTPGRAIAGEYRIEGIEALCERWEAGALDRALAAGLAWASYVVGMELPGLHSLLSGITLLSNDGGGGTAPARFEIELLDHDQRTGQLTVEGRLGEDSGDSLLAARIDSFARFPTAAPDPGALGLRRDGAPAPDRGVAIVVGASRGFGAALSLALLARGYEVHGAASSLTADGAMELRRLAGDAGPRLHLHPVDARDPEDVERLIVDTGRRPLAGLVLNAALPPLPMGLTSESARDLVDYVDSSLLLAAVPLGALLPLVSSDGGWVLFCSSSALAAPPRDWPHYVTAKAALEGLALWVAHTFPGLRTVVLRPPAMRTEMTNTPSGRIAPVATEPVASRVADGLAGGEFPSGLSMLEPDTLAPS